MRTSVSPSSLSASRAAAGETWQPRLIDDVALDTVLCQHSMNPEPVEPGLLDDHQRG